MEEEKEEDKHATGGGGRIHGYMHKVEEKYMQKGKQQDMSRQGKKTGSAQA